ncbi:DNA double-strand break repair nuclease NurA [Caldisphaera sp.]|uniref:DNA double-strand break repair nuclease NurA n=1 Tax=Caldisphaera sp. TaxID=2060322 RepID=UPI003D1355AF
MKILSEISYKESYLGSDLPSGIVDETSYINYEGEIDRCEPLDEFGYLDSSSRIINVRGANLYLASLYANDNGKHILIPLDASIPFIAIKGSSEVINKVKDLGFIVTENVNHVQYSVNYKDDNILDELRISLENYAINNAKSKVLIVDGPIFPGPYTKIIGEPYKSAFETLNIKRKTENLIGIVKRLSFTRKLSREENIAKKYKKLVDIGATDDIIVFEMSKGFDKFISPIYKEEVEILKNKFYRYMVYIKVRNSVFRVESRNKELLCEGVWTSIKNTSIRGIPTFIEAADKISRRLSASTYLISFINAMSLMEVNYDDWNRYIEAMRDLSE